MEGNDCCTEGNDRCTEGNKLYTEGNDRCMEETDCCMDSDHCTDRNERFTDCEDRCTEGNVHFTEGKDRCTKGKEYQSNSSITAKDNTCAGDRLMQWSTQNMYRSLKKSKQFSFFHQLHFIFKSKKEATFLYMFDVIKLWYNRSLFSFKFCLLFLKLRI